MRQSLVVGEWVAMDDARRGFRRGCQVQGTKLTRWEESVQEYNNT